MSRIMTLRGSWLLCLSLGFVGCTVSGGFRVEPSAYELTEQVREYVDGLEPSGESMDVLAIPYVSKSTATSRFADEFDWFFLYTCREEIGKLENGYVYQDVDMLCPVLVAAQTVLFDEDGKRSAERNTSLLGLYWLFPFIDFVSLGSERFTDVRSGSSSWDGAINLLRIPGVDAGLLSLGTAKVDLLFLPLWRKNRAPASVEIETDDVD